MGTVIIDPITRIEGHLKATLTTDTYGVVIDALISGTMARGIEKLLQGRDPRDAPYVTERICGVCYTAHGITSSMAVEKAQGTTEVPKAAKLIRNLISGGAWLHDHILHFYHLSLPDFLNLGVLTNYNGNDTYILKLKELVINEINNPPLEGEYAGPFLPTYLTDEYCINDLEKIVYLLQNYFAALQIQAKAKKMSAIFGGKQPHQSAIIPGGVTQLPDNSKILNFRSLLNEITQFIKNTYIPDVLDITNNYLFSLAQSSVGVGYQNYLSFGGFQELDNSFLYPEGAIINGILNTTSREEIIKDITENVTYSWYTSSSGGYPTTSDQIFDLNKPEAYTFIKAPRFKNQPMEVGPLARLMVALRRNNHSINNHPAIQQFKDLLNRGMQPGLIARHVARALETLILCDAMYKWLNELESLINSGNTIIHDSAHWNPPAKRNRIWINRGSTWCFRTLDLNKKLQDSKLCLYCSDNMECFP